MTGAVKNLIAKRKHKERDMEIPVTQGSSGSQRIRSCASFYFCDGKAPGDLGIGMTILKGFPNKECHIGRHDGHPGEVLPLDIKPD